MVAAIGSGPARITCSSASAPPSESQSRQQEDMTASIMSQFGCTEITVSVHLIAKESPCPGDSVWEEKCHGRRFGQTTRNSRASGHTINVGLFGDFIDGRPFSKT